LLFTSKSKLYQGYIQMVTSYVKVFEESTEIEK